MDNKITIAITSCGRINLLKKTIKSLEQSCDISKYNKIISEDTTNQDKINKIKLYNKDGFLKGWKIIFTGGKGNTNYEKHYNALETLYSNINSLYVFHCEDDWFFKKCGYNFIDVSKKILENNKQIGIVQLRDFGKDGGFNDRYLSKEKRKEEIFHDKILNLEGRNFIEFRNDIQGDKYKGFSLNPGLRRTVEMKKIIFGYENYIDEVKIGERMSKLGIKSINFNKGICYHIGNSFLSTKVIEKGLVKGIIKTIKGTYKYRIEAQLIKAVNILYYKLDLIKPMRYLMDVISWLYRYITVDKININQLQNIEGIKEMNIPINWFYENKKTGLSGIARLKNADSFLEKIIESHITHLDEIILIDNQSKDSTKDICIKLQNKYPKKIKFFEYNYYVYPPGTEKNIKSNSIHSLAYYYNWSFSKSSYSHVMKMDDDNLLIDEKWIKLKNKSINSNNYNTYWGYNLIKDNEGNYGVLKDYLYSGKYGDHGIYKVSEYTYYIQGKDFELFKNNLFYIRNGFSFIHLKFLKNNFGFSNLVDSQYKKNYIKKISEKIIKYELILNKKDSNIIKKYEGII